MYIQTVPAQPCGGIRQKMKLLTINDLGGKKHGRIRSYCAGGKKQGFGTA